MKVYSSTKIYNFQKETKTVVTIIVAISYSKTSGEKGSLCGLSECSLRKHFYSNTTTSIHISNPLSNIGLDSAMVADKNG